MNFVRDESRTAKHKHPPFQSVHHAYGIILEEVDEYWDEVRKKSSIRDHASMLKELVQIAAMCVRAGTEIHMPKVESKNTSGCSMPTFTTR